MAKKIHMNARMAYINKPKEYWETTNPILEDGEMGFVSDVNENEWCKVGDGRTPWNDLPWKKGPKGDKGDAFVYTDFTKEQLGELSGSAAEEVEKDLEENTEFVFYGGDATASSEPLTKTKCYRLDICDELPDGADLNDYLNTGNWNFVVGRTYVNSPSTEAAKLLVEIIGKSTQYQYIRQTVIDLSDMTYTRFLSGALLSDGSIGGIVSIGSWSCTNSEILSLNIKVYENTSKINTEILPALDDHEERISNIGKSMSISGTTTTDGNLQITTNINGIIPICCLKAGYIITPYFSTNGNVLMGHVTLADGVTKVSNTVVSDVAFYYIQL